MARWLLSQLDSAAYIEGDVLGFVSLELILNQPRKGLILDIALDLIESYRSKGAKTIIFDNLFTEVAQLDSFKARITAPVHVFYLSASPEILNSRIRKRGRPQAEREVVEASEIESIQRNSFSSSHLGFEIKTDNLSPEEIVDRIKQRLSE